MFIRIEPGSGIAIWRQIADQIRAQCASEVLRPGDKLPSMRELARELAVNQNTILRVYERLTGEGLLERRHGSGTYVAQDIATEQLKATQRALLWRQVEQLARKAETLGVSGDELRGLVDEALDRDRRGPESPDAERARR